MPKSPKGNGDDPRQSAEFKAFDAAMERMIRVPKAELDRKLASLHSKRRKTNEDDVVEAKTGTEARSGA